MKIITLKDTLGEQAYNAACKSTWEKLSLLREVILEKKERKDMITDITWCVNKKCVKYYRCGRSIKQFTKRTKRDIKIQRSMAEFIPTVNDEKNFKCEYFMEEV